MIIDLEVLADQVGHPFARPQRRFVPQGLRALLEQFHQAGLVGLIQTGKSSRSTGSPQSDVASLLMFLPPPAHCLVAYLQATAYLAIVEILIEQLRRPEAALLQCHKVAFNATGIAHTALDDAGAKQFRYIMRNSIVRRPC